MRKLLSILSISVSLLAAAQSYEPGSRGELLRNELPTSGMQSRTYGGQDRYPGRYDWNYTGGTAEVFLRIPERGNFEVQVGDQRIASPSGRFRFFDLIGGRIPIAIYERGQLVYRSQVQVQPGMRVVLDYFSRYGMYRLGIFPASGGDSIWNDPYQTGGGYPSPYPNTQPFPRPYLGNTRPYYNREGMRPEQFNAFINTLRRRSFDDDRMRTVQVQSRSTFFSSRQVAEIISLFDFDDKQLELAKNLYRQTVDPENYFVVTEVLKFPSSRQELEDFLASQRRY